MKKILISQRIDFLSSRNEYRDSLDQKITELLVELDYLVIPIPNIIGDMETDKRTNFISSISPEGIILSGGNSIGAYQNRDTLEYSLIDYGIKNNIPILGICRGMQIIASYFGVGLTKVKGHICRKHCVKGIYNHEVICFHEYMIKMCPKGFTITAMSDDDKVIEAISSEKPFIKGIMWHPERKLPFSNNDKKLLRSIFR